MSSKEAEVYIMGDEEDGEGWVSPKPVRTAIVETVAAETDLGADDLDDVETYVDMEDLREVLEGDGGTVAFRVEGHEVTVDADGNIVVD